MTKKLLITGSSGLIGSEVCQYFSRELGYEIHGIDNNQRAVFFGPQGDTRWNQQRLASELQSGHLITYVGDGHTAYMRSNSCVDDAVDAYLVKGVVPPRGLRC